MRFRLHTSKVWSGFPHVIWLVSLSLIAILCVQVWLVSYMTHIAAAIDPASVTGPLSVVADVGGVLTPAPSWVPSTVEVLSVITGLLLVCLWFLLDPSHVLRSQAIPVVLCASCMAVISLLTTSVSSADLYAYAADARLGIQCYVGGQVFPVSDSFHIVHRYWGHPVIPCAYGPLWIGAVHLLLGWCHSLYGVISGLRVLNFVSFVFCVSAIVRLSRSLRPVAVMVLDPVVHLQFLSDGHNDLMMVAFLLWARVFSLNGKYIPALILCALAGGSKLPFLLLAPLMFQGVLDRRHRIVYASLSVLFGLLVSAVFGGRAYVSALSRTASIYATDSTILPVLLHVLFVVSVIAVMLSVIFRRTQWPCSWSFAGLGSTVFPWYIAWCFPYAMLDPDEALPFLASIPLLAFSVSTIYRASSIWPFFVLLMTILGLLVFVLGIRSHFRPAVEVGVGS